MANEVTREELEKKVSEKEQEVAYLRNQCNGMMSKIKELADVLSYRRLDYLFKVVENADKFPSDFLNTCVDEIVENMTIPEPKDQKEEN